MSVCASGILFFKVETDKKIILIGTLLGFYCLYSKAYSRKVARLWVWLKPYPKHRAYGLLAIISVARW